MNFEHFHDLFYKTKKNLKKNLKIKLINICVIIISQKKIKKNINLLLYFLFFII